jgi:alkylation response protein AidB-like acyl-CoA dehydrogenase
VGTHDLKGWRLNGTKPWCSLGGRLDNALVTAQVADGKRQLFAVSLRQESVTADTSGAWVARGMQNLPSGPVHFNDTPARPIGEHGWYLNRPGFSWGGIGVAACWFGGAAALADQLLSKTVEKASKSSEVSEISALHLGAVDTALHAGAASLRDAAAQIDHGLAETASSELLALRVRAGVAAAVEETMRHVGHALGPAPLAFDEEYARRTADLGLYVRQHHGERDLTILGAALMREGEASSQAAHE